MASKTKVPVTKKTTLRTLPAEFQGVIFQSNRITNAKYDYSLIQERIFNAIMCKLRDQIGLVMHGTPVRQLDLFSHENIILKIPLQAISKPAYYKKVRETLSDMAVIKIEIPKTYNGHEGMILQGLFATWVPAERTRNGEIVIKIDHHVAEVLLNIDRNFKGQPMQYTSFMIDVCLQAKNKYTPRIYKFISSWKEKGGVSIPLEKFRDMLQLGDKYITYKDLKKRILKPVADELKQIADCYFNCADAAFAEKEGKNIVGLNFKILKHHNENYNITIWRNLQHILGTSEFMMRGGHLAQLQYLADQHDVEAVYMSVKRIHKYLFDENARYKGIRDLQAYLIDSLKKEFPPNS